MSSEGPEQSAPREAADTGTAPPRSQGRGRLWVLATVLLVVVVALAWYAEEIRGFCKLQAWDREAPAATVAAFGEALATADVATLERIAPGMALEVSEGAIAKMKPPSATPQMPPQDPAKYTPALPLRDPDVAFSYVKSMATVTVRSQTGDLVTAELDRSGGAWRIAALYVSK